MLVNNFTEIHKDKDTHSMFHLSQEQIDQFERDGFTVLRSVVSAEEVQNIRQLIVHLFERFNNLPKALAHDMSEFPYSLNTLRNPEISKCLQLEPRLAKTEYPQITRMIARQLLGPQACLCFDHAILKPPHSNCPTPWHQDEAYDKPNDSKRRVSCWLPLQDVSVDHGCLQYIPGSHKGELLPHHFLAAGSKVLTTTQVTLDRAVPCPVKLGDVIIHTGRTLHYAGPNITPRPRLAWVLVLAAIDKSPRARLRRLYKRILSASSSYLHSATQRA